MSTIYSGPWRDIGHQEIFTDSASKVKKIIEITHRDGSIQSFSEAFFNRQGAPYHFSLDVLVEGEKVLLEKYTNGISPKFGKFQTVRVYPMYEREKFIRSAIYLLPPNLQTIVVQLLNAN